MNPPLLYCECKGRQNFQTSKTFYKKSAKKCKKSVFFEKNRQFSCKIYILMNKIGCCILGATTYLSSQLLLHRGVLLLFRWTILLDHKESRHCSIFDWRYIHSDIAWTTTTIIFIPQIVLGNSHFNISIACSTACIKGNNI